MASPKRFRKDNNYVVRAKGVGDVEAWTWRPYKPSQSGPIGPWLPNIFCRGASKQVPASPANSALNFA